MWRHEHTQHSGRWAWLLLVLSAAAIYPALIWNSGAVAYDAALQHIYRGLLFSGAISDGVLYPRWVQFLHLGLGSPLFTFQAPLPYFAMDGLFRLGLPHPLGWRLLVAGGLLAAGLGTYLLVHTLTGQKWPAIVAAVAYLYAPYVLRNTLERGSNEVYSMFLYPWVLWGLIWLARRPSYARFLIATLLWAACIASHVLGPLMLAPVAVLVAIGGWRHRTIAPALALVAGGLLTAFIWAPMIPEQAYVHVERDFEHPDAQPWNHPIALSDLLALPVAYDVARENNDSGNRIGLLHTVLLALGLPAAFYAWKTGRRHLALFLVAASALGLVLLWSFTSAADSTWHLLAPVLGRVQYRSRLMGLQALAAAAVAGLIVALLPVRWQRRLGLVLAGLLILTALPSLYINLRHHYAPFDTTITWGEVRNTEIKLGGNALTAYSEFTPRWRTAPFDDALIADLGPGFDPQARPLADPPAGVLVRSARVRSSDWDVLIESPISTTLAFYLLYYPRWQARLDGQPVALRPQAETGYVQLDFPSGSHRVTFHYGTTAVERAGLVISGLSLGVILFVGVLACQGIRRRSLRVLSLRVLSLRTIDDQRLPGQPSTRSQDESQGQTAGADLQVGPSEASPPVLAPPLWLLLVLTGLLAFKILYVDPATLWFRCKSTQTRVCGADGSVSIPFDRGMRLRGYRAPQEVQRGHALPISLFWQADYPIKTGLNAFLHIRNSEADWPLNPRTGNDIWAQEEIDGPGGFFTTGYLPGRIYVDERHLLIPEDMPPGNYFLEVGWYDPETGEQLEPDPASLQPPLRILWRSVLLPPVQVK